ncbi:MAG TPA: hypothetical protein VNT60_01270 [Deinococcales bacterium]|nr:hypothetical protein [Deinococcales bacterium]
MRAALLAVLAAITLAACNSTPTPAASSESGNQVVSNPLLKWQGSARGQVISFSVVPDDEIAPAVGRADYTKQVSGQTTTFTCQVRVVSSIASAGSRADARTADRRTLASVLFHEFGHCLDWVFLGYKSAGFGSTGSQFGPYFATAPEGYAEAYAMAALASCGADLAAANWPGVKERAGSRSCLPDPTSVTPDQMSAYLGTRNNANIAGLALSRVLHGPY